MTVWVDFLATKWVLFTESPPQAPPSGRHPEVDVPSDFSTDTVFIDVACVR